jgi:hypothetical protein
VVRSAFSDRYQPPVFTQPGNLALFLCFATASAARIGSIVLNEQYRGTEEHYTRCITYGDYVPTIFANDKDPKGPNRIAVRFTIEHAKTETDKGKRYYLLPRAEQAMSGPLYFIFLALRDGAIAGKPDLATLLDPAQLDGHRSRELGIDPAWSVILRPHTYMLTSQGSRRCSPPSGITQRAHACQPDPRGSRKVLQA